MTNQQPATGSEREIFMDVLRGFAILGIFIANLKAFTWYGTGDPSAPGNFILPGADEKMSFLHHVFIEGKFYSIFSFLFGWGIALQLQKSTIHHIPSTSFIRRRLFIMLLLGAFHLLLWPGDIVFLYALIGFILLPLRRFSNKALLITAVGLLLSPILLYALKMQFPVLNTPSSFLYKIGMQADERLIGVTSEESFMKYLQSAGWYEILLGDLSGFFYRYGDLFFQSRIPKVLGMMLIGLVAGRTGFYSQLDQYRKWVYVVIVAGLLIGLPANYCLATYMELKDGSYQNLTMKGLYRTISYAAGVAPLAMAYIGMMMLLFRYTVLNKFLRILAPVGKMAFTNYLMHTIIGNLFFLPAGLGHMGEWGPVYYTLFALIVFIGQVIFSHLWLRYFNYGPVEWVWRSATYRQWQPMLQTNKNDPHL